MAAIESQLLIKTRTLQILSEQQVLNCAPNQGGCSGGDPYQLLNDLQSKGIVHSQDYPYTGSDSVCLKNFTEENFIVTGQSSNYYIGGYESILLNLVKNSGPVVVTVYKTFIICFIFFLIFLNFQLHASEKFMLYKSGIFIDDTCNLVPNHSVLVVGFGTENNLDYW